MSATPADVAVVAADQANPGLAWSRGAIPSSPVAPDPFPVRIGREVQGPTLRIGPRASRSRTGRVGLPALLLLLGLSLAWSAPAPTETANAAHEVHGESDAFGTVGAALAWGVVRGPSEAATEVVVRIVSDPALYPWLAADSRDPFTQRTQPILAKVRNPGLIGVRSSRAHFADFPRTDFRFYDSEAAARLDRPALVVFFLGVPDTTPEFKTEEKLQSHLAHSITRLRSK